MGGPVVTWTHFSIISMNTRGQLVIILFSLHVVDRYLAIVIGCLGLTVPILKSRSKGEANFDWYCVPLTFLRDSTQSDVIDSVSDIQMLPERNNVRASRF